MAVKAEEVQALLAEALKELAALPDEDLRLVLQAARNQFWRATSGATETAAAQVALAGGAVAGKASITGNLAVTLAPVTLEGRVAGGAALVRAPAFRRALANPAARGLLLDILGGAAWDGIKLLAGPLLAAAAARWCASQPAPSGEPPQPPAVVQQVPAPQPPACFPPDEPAQR